MEAGELVEGRLALLVEQGDVLAVDVVDVSAGRVVLQLQLAEQLVEPVRVLAADAAARLHLVAHGAQLVAAAQRRLGRVLRPVVQATVLALQTLTARHRLQYKSIVFFIHWKKKQQKKKLIRLLQPLRRDPRGGVVTHQ